MVILYNIIRFECIVKIPLVIYILIDHGTNAQGLLSYTTAQGIFSYNVTDYWKVAATAVHCGTAGMNQIFLAHYILMKYYFNPLRFST